MLRKVLLLTISLIPSTAVFAGAIDFRVGRDVAEISYLTQASSFGYGGADIGYGALINNDNDVLASASVLVSGSNAGDVKALHLGVGAKAYAGALEGPGASSLNVDGGAIAIGLRVRYVFPGNAPFAVLGEAFYAPEVTSISDFDGLQEYRFALEMEVTPSARAYIGYRNLEVDNSKVPDYKVDDEAHIGVRFEF